MAVAFSPDGQYVVTGGADHIARIFEVGNGKELSRFTEAGEISAVTFSPNGWQVATAGWDGTRVFETATGREVARVPGDSRDRGLMPGNSAVVFSPNGRFLASGNGDV